MPARAGEGQRHDQQHGERQRQQRLLPAQPRDQQLFDRHHEELPEGAGGGRHAHGPGPPRRVDLPADHAVDHRVRGAGLRRADQHARGEGENQGVGRQRHARQAQRVQQRAGDQHPERAEAVGQHAGEDADEAPGQVLHRDGEGEGLARPVLRLRDRLQPQSEAVPHAHGERDDERAAGEHLRHRQLGGSGGLHPRDCSELDGPALAGSLTTPRRSCRPGSAAPPDVAGWMPIQ